MIRVVVLIAALCVLTSCGSAPENPSEPSADTITPKPDTPLSADFGTYGPYRVGMTAAEVRGAAHGALREETQGGIDNCLFFTDPDVADSPANRLGLTLPRTAGYRLVGIHLPLSARTKAGIGYGSEAAEVRSAYAGHAIELTDSQAGTEILVRGDEADSYFGFSVRDDHIVAVRTGSHDYAANYELCSG